MRDDGDDRVAQTDPTHSSAAEGAAEPATVATSSFRLHQLGPYSNPAASQGFLLASGGAAVAGGGSALLLNVQLSPLLLAC